MILGTAVLPAVGSSGSPTICFSRARCCSQARRPCWRRSSSARPSLVGSWRCPSSDHYTRGGSCSQGTARPTRTIWPRPRRVHFSPSCSAGRRWSCANSPGRTSSKDFGVRSSFTLPPRLAALRTWHSARGRHLRIYRRYRLPRRAAAPARRCAECASAVNKTAGVLHVHVSSSSFSRPGSPIRLCASMCSCSIRPPYRCRWGRPRASQPARNESTNACSHISPARRR